MNQFLRLSAWLLISSFSSFLFLTPFNAYSDAPPPAQVSQNQTGHQVPVKPAEQPQSSEPNESQTSAADESTEKENSAFDTTGFFLKEDTLASSERNPISDKESLKLEKEIMKEKVSPATSGYDSLTGITTQVTRHRGNETITRTDEYGQVIDSETRSRRTGSLISGYEYDSETGLTTSVVRNRDGNYTLTQKDASGNTLNQLIIGENGIVTSKVIEPVKMATSPTAIQPTAIQTTLAAPVKMTEPVPGLKTPVPVQQTPSVMTPDQGKVQANPLTVQSTNEVNFKLPSLTRGSEVQQSLRNFYGGIYEIPALVSAEETKKDEWKIKIARSKFKTRFLQGLLNDLVTLKLVNGKIVVTQMVTTDALGRINEITDLAYDQRGELMERHREILNQKGEKQQDMEIFYEKGEEALSVLKYFEKGQLVKQSVMAREFDSLGNVTGQTVWVVDKNNKPVGTQVNRYFFDEQGKTSYHYQMEYSGTGDLMHFFFSTGTSADQRAIEVKMLPGNKAQVKMTVPSERPGSKKESELTVSSEEIQKLVDDFFRKSGKAVGTVNLTQKAPEFPVSLRFKK